MKIFFFKYFKIFQDLLTLVALHWDGRFDFDHNFDSDATLVDSDNKNLDHTRDILCMGFL